MVLTAILARFPSHLVVLGVFLFLVSDSVLAVDRFKTAVPMRGLLVWTTYYLAQYSISRGVLPPQNSGAGGLRAAQGGRRTLSFE